MKSITGNQLSNLTSRIDRLEAVAGVGGETSRYFYVVCGGAPDDDAAAWVRSQGYECDPPTDFVVRLVGISAPGVDDPVHPMGFCGGRPTRGAIQ